MLAAAVVRQRHKASNFYPAIKNSVMSISSEMRCRLCKRQADRDLKRRLMAREI